MSISSTAEPGSSAEKNVEPGILSESFHPMCIVSFILSLLTTEDLLAATTLGEPVSHHTPCLMDIYRSSMHPPRTKEYRENRKSWNETMSLKKHTVRLELAIRSTLYAYLSSLE